MGASGPHQGLTAAQWVATGNPMPWEVVALCWDSADPALTLRELQTTLDVHDALDLLDIAEVKRSHEHAGLLNQESNCGN